MKQILLLILLLILSICLLIGLSCGGSGGSGGGVAASCPVCTTCTPSTGIFCDSCNCPQALTAGRCDSSATTTPIAQQCPPPYNYCCLATDVGKLSYCASANICAVQPAASSDKRIWFATDPIRPGVNAGDPPSAPSGSGYIYNIMAKGYASLDDWCMSQAQQSTLPSMRKKASWTALILAQPDNSGSFSAGLNRLNLMTPTINSSGQSILPYTNPNTQAFSNSYNIYDKNGSSTPTQFWTAMGGQPGSPSVWTSPNGESAADNFQLPQPGPFCAGPNNNAWGTTSVGNCAAAYIPAGIGGLSTSNVIGFFVNNDSSSGYCVINNDQGQCLKTNYDYQIGLSSSNPIICLANQT